MAIQFRPTRTESRYAFLPSSSSLALTPSLTNLPTSSPMSASTLPMFTGLVMAVTLNRPAEASWASATNDDPVP